MRAIVSFAVLAVIIPTMVAAQSVAPPPRPLYLRGDHWTPYDPPTEFPEGVTVHIIEKGDTLWDLAERYLGDPYLWPQIWERNPYVKDSHWIYPGDPLVIDIAVQPAVPTEEERVPTGDTTVSQAPEERVGPDYEEYQEIERPPDVPRPLGSSADVYCFARLIQDPSVFPYSIVAAEETMKMHFSEGEIVYINGGINQGVNAGDRFFVFHQRRPLRHPVSGAGMGTVYDQAGQILVLCAQEDTAIAEISFACDPIGIGDHLMPFQPVPVPLVIDPPATDRCDTPNGKPTGYVVFAKDDVIDSGVEQLIFLDLGVAEGLYPGMFATVFRDNPVAGMPRIVTGEVGILTVEEGYSTAKITRGWTPVTVGDRVELK